MQRLIGRVLLLHWILLAVQRISSGNGANLLWMSHLGLLVAALGFLSGNDLLITAALLMVLIGHAAWLVDFALMLARGSAWGISSYFFELSALGKLLTIHHLYLLPLMFALVRKIHPHGWLIASAAFAVATLAVFVLLPGENVNCAARPCGSLVETIPLLAHLPRGGLYLVLLNAATDLLAFALPNLALLWARENFLVS